MGNLSTRPTEINERKKVGMFAPPPIIFGGAALLCVVGHFLWSSEFTFTYLRTLLALIIIIASTIIIVLSESQFKKAGTPVRPLTPATAIVTTGPYRFSRNPMYMGMAGMLVGFGILLGSNCYLLMLTPVLLLIHFGVILPEEKYLEVSLGDAYRQYKRSVRRWL